jgi:dTDP-4-amino-4,6-dideoxygalactose transaminase
LNNNHIKIPYEEKKDFHTYHTFVIQVKKRDELKNFLLNKGVETSIHYPVPIHLQPAAKMFGYKKGDFAITESQSKEILTLPVNENLSNLEVVKISNLINSFFDK